MASFKLRRFISQPGILRGISPENLMSLLTQHASALQALGFMLPAASYAASIDYSGLMSLLMEPGKLPADLCEALFFIHEMATHEGMICLLEAADQSGLEIIGHPTPSPGDVAVQVWLKDRELLECKHAEQFLQNVRSYQSYGTCVTPLPSPADARPQLAAMKDELDDFFEKKKRGRNTKIFPYFRNDGIWFLIRHGDPFKREGAIDEKGESYGAYYWPEKFDVLVLNTLNGELRINARSKGERQTYRQIMGRYFYGDEKFFSVENRYTLEPLRQVGMDSIAPIEGIDEVSLIEICFLWGGSHGEKEIRRADDVFAAYEDRGATFPTRPRIVKASFRVTFSDSDRPRTVTIKPPNEALYMRDEDSLIVEKWLTARGFIIQQEIGEPHDSATEPVLAIA